MRCNFCFSIVLILLGWKLSFAENYSIPQLQQLNDQVEQFVSDKQYAEAISFCNAELQKTYPKSIHRFLIVTKARLCAKSRIHLDSIPVLFDEQNSLSAVEDSLNSFLTARALEIYGHYNFITNQYVESINYLNKADSAYSLTPSYSNRIYNLNMLGTIYQLDDKLSDALFALLRALELHQEHTPTDSVTFVDLQIDIGLAYFNLQQYDKALSTYGTLTKIQVSEKQRAQVLNNLGIIFTEKNQFDIARIHFHQAKALYEKLHSKRDLSHIYNNLGSVLENIGSDLDSVLYYYNKSLSIKKEIGDFEGMVSSYINLSTFYLAQGNLNEAQKNLNKAFELTNYFNAQDLATVYFLKSRVQSGLNQHEAALESFTKYHFYQDSANQINSIWQSKKVETTIALNQKEKEIELLKREKELVEVVNSQQKIQFIASLGIAIATILILALIAFYYYKKQRFQHKLRSREVKLASITNLVTGQEEERLRMAKELHDGVGNNLAIINAELIRDFSNENKENVLNLVSQTSEEVRNITHDLMPVTVKKLGLQEAIKDLAEKWRHSSSSLIIDLNFQIENLKIDKHSELTIYRIIQELIKNAVQHGKADYIILEIHNTPDEIHLLFEDNGCGMDNSKTFDKNGIGYRTILSRVAYLNGEIKLKTDSNGVRFNFIFRKPNYENTTG